MDIRYLQRDSPTTQLEKSRGKSVFLVWFSTEDMSFGLIVFLSAFTQSQPGVRVPSHVIFVCNARPCCKSPAKNFSKIERRGRRDVESEQNMSAYKFQNRIWLKSPSST